MKCGVLQRSILGILLNITYINDLPLNMHVNSKLLRFANHMSVLIISNNLQDLQRHPTSILNQMNKWSVANGLSLNIEHTNVIHIKWNHLQDRPFQISYQNVEIEEETNTKFLGLCLDQHMERKTHIDLIITKCMYLALLYVLLELSCCPEVVTMRREGCKDGYFWTTVHSGPLRVETYRSASV